MRDRRERIQNQTCVVDKGYLSRENLELVEKHGGSPFIPFKVNSQPGEAGSLWERMFGYFQFKRDEFLKRYQRSVTKVRSRWSKRSSEMMCEV